MSLSADGSRAFVTTRDDHGGVALTVCTLSSTWMLLCFGVRIYVRRNLNGPFGRDDLACTFATLFAVITTIVSGVSIGGGFGKATSLLSPSQIALVEKTSYASQLLFLSANCLTKCSMTFLFARITPMKRHNLACNALLLVSVLWGVGSILGEAIRCAEGQPWKIVQINGQCHDYLLIWRVITAFDVSIEAAFLVMPIWVVWNLQTSLNRKATVVGIFSLRSPVIVAAILRIHYIARVGASGNPFLDSVIPFVCLQVEMNYGLIASTLPCLRPFVARFDTGWGTHDAQGISDYSLHTMDKKTSWRSRPRMTVSNKGKLSRDETGPRLRPDRLGNNTTLIRSATPQPDLAASHPRSSDSSQRMIIHQTVTCEVQYETPDPGPSVESLEVDDHYLGYIE